ncbi:CBO0543 family protein [Pelosinus baikalensis]|uniref:Transmembrane protein n=1 Tax=Pelosinus baikalensis TaxID=2892015 RepID=A0ABS8HZJ5_9FIRM|nr:CBO0543 family protein [Pelosinus baikalensis]MCC5468573.1 hypothetical protein [Pelosinus baikalensis]MCC5468590.1 hypothetical protein [Pelosinus baikalensis]
MDFFYTRFLISWACWLIFADRSRWKEMVPVCAFALCLSLISDQIVEWYVIYWEYYGNEPKIIRELMDDFDVYIIVTYLFIQWLPKKQSYFIMFYYWFAWTALAITIEYIHVKTGHMAHYNGWTFWHSYISDWILFWLFYQYHKFFQLEKLSK